MSSCRCIAVSSQVLDDLSCQLDKLRCNTHAANKHQHTPDSRPTCRAGAGVLVLPSTHHAPFPGSEPVLADAGVPLPGVQRRCGDDSVMHEAPDLPINPGRAL